MTIDVHAHVIPPGIIGELERSPSRYGLDVVRDGDDIRLDGPGGRLGPLRSDLLDVNERIAAMDRAGVTIQVLSNWINLTAYDLQADAGARFARMFNEQLTAVTAEHPDRFRALATVPLQDPVAAAAELGHAVIELEMVGVEIATTVANRELDDPGLDPFWAAAADLRAFVLVHPMDPLAGRGVSRYFLGNAVGRPAETTIAVAHLVMAGVLERHPELRLCVVHGGGFLPYQHGRLDRAYHAKPELAAKHLSRPPSEWLRRLYYDTVVHDPEVIAWLVDFVGADHVLLGSDYPFEMGDTSPVRTVEAVPDLDDEQRRQILSGNARRLIDEVHARSVEAGSS